MNTTTAAPLAPKPQTSLARLDRELAEIRRVVAEHNSIERADLTSGRRDEPLATIRQMAMVLSRELTRATLEKVAFSFARTDHGTVMHAVKVVPQKLEQSAVLRVEFELLRNKCTAALAALK